MKKIIFFLTGLFLFSSLFAQQINDENAIKVDVKNFSTINVSNAFDVYLTQGNDDAVAISASEKKYRDRIKVEVKNDVLYVSYESGLHLNSGKKKLKAYISFRSVNKLVVSGACDVFVLETMKADKLNIHLSGASDLKGKLEVNELTVDLSGASDMRISGKAAKLNVESSGASDFRGFEFATDYCEARASGASSVQVTVNKEINANASGASDVHFKGDAVIKNFKSSGASNVSKG